MVIVSGRNQNFVLDLEYGSLEASAEFLISLAAGPRDPLTLCAIDGHITASVSNRSVR
jgi:hypothetical protein